jgi:chromate transporter
MSFFPCCKRKSFPQDGLTADEFLAGYGAAQAVPGSLFTFASYIGMASFGWKGALAAIIAIFLPSFLLIIRNASILELAAPSSSLPSGARQH